MTVALTHEERSRIYDVYVANGRSAARAAEALGLSRGTIHHHVKRFEDGTAQKDALVTMPSFVVDGDEEEPIEALLSRRLNGFAEYQHGAAIMAIIDPETAKVMCFSDPEEGAAYLAFKRR